MEVKLTLINKNHRDKEGITLILPTEDKNLFSILDKLTDGDTYDEIIVVDYKSPLYIDFSIYDGNDLYDVNSNLKKLNQCATESEMIALSEIYSYLPDILYKAQRGNYEFYPNITLADLANMRLKDEPYGYFKALENDGISIISDLYRQGYQETSVGVILMLES